MTVGEIKNAVMFQTNNDTDDVGDFLPYLMDYINEGYDLLVFAYTDTHLTSNPGAAYAPLHENGETPALPAWMHHAIADWATWCVYRNGNSQKQQRGYAFRSAFDEVCQKIVAEGKQNGKVRYFTNIPW